jgi:16S rRNA (guanine527-N7)-methyltransferase
VLTDDPDLRAVLETAQTRGFIGDGDLTPHVANALGFAAAHRSSRHPAPTAATAATAATTATAGGAGEPGDDPQQASTQAGQQAPHQVLDLGSGGGLPGLVLARHWPDSRVVLLDASEQRTAFLAEAVDRLAWRERVRVLRGRAELLAHEDEWRNAFDLVVARSFGPPAVVAECAAGFLAVGGVLIVSEPPATPESAGRWDHADELATLGLVYQPFAASPDGVADGRADGGADGDAEKDSAAFSADAALPRSAGSFAVLTCSSACPDRYPRRVGIPAKRPLF